MDQRQILRCFEARVAVECLSEGAQGPSDGEHERFWKLGSGQCGNIILRMHYTSACVPHSFIFT